MESRLPAMCFRFMPAFLDAILSFRSREPKVRAPRSDARNATSIVDRNARLSWLAECQAEVFLHTRVNANSRYQTCRPF